MGQTSEGRNLLRRSVDITHEMALQLIKQCQEENVDCIVAPYEADAQLAYLNINGIADVIITEDSDLTLFGCKKVRVKTCQINNSPYRSSYWKCDSFLQNYRDINFFF